MLEEKKSDNVLKRPDLLTVLCILSFIGGGLALLSNILIYLFNDEMRTVLSSQNFQTFMGAKLNFSMFLTISPSFFLLQALFSALSIIGVALMWKMSQMGFHLYTTAQIVLLIIPKLFISGLPFPWFELSLSLLFVYLYGKSLKVF